MKRIVLMQLSKKELADLRQKDKNELTSIEKKVLSHTYEMGNEEVHHNIIGDWI